MSANRLLDEEEEASSDSPNVRPPEYADVSASSRHDAETSTDDDLEGGIPTPPSLTTMPRQRLVRDSCSRKGLVILSLSLVGLFLVAFCIGFYFRQQS